MTRLDDARRREDPSPFEVRLVAETRDVVVATGGLKVTPDCTLDECPPLDVLVVPGGWGTRRLLEHAPLIDWIARARRRGADAHVGLHRRAAARSGRSPRRPPRDDALALARSACASASRGSTVEDALHVVEDGHVFTSAGISAGIDMALRVVTRLYGERIGRETARHMEYPYPDDNRRRVSGGRRLKRPDLCGCSVAQRRSRASLCSRSARRRPQ